MGVRPRRLKLTSTSSNLHIEVREEIVERLGKRGMGKHRIAHIGVTKSAHDRQLQHRHRAFVLRARVGFGQADAPELRIDEDRVRCKPPIR